MSLNSIYLPAEDLKDLNKLMKGEAVKVEFGASKKTAGEGMLGAVQEANIQSIVIEADTVDFPIIMEAVIIASKKSSTEQELNRGQEILDGVLERKKQYKETKEIKIFGKESAMGFLLEKELDHGAKFVYGGE